MELTEDSTGREPLRKRRDLQRRKFPKSVALVGVLGFVAGAIVNPLLDKAVERYGNVLFQGFDDSLGNSALIAKELSWPWADCRQAAVAVMPGGPSPEGFVNSAQGLDPFVLTQSGVTVPWNAAQLRLLLTARQPDDVLMIESIKLRIYKYIEGDAYWTAVPPRPACSGSDKREFEATLQSGDGAVVDKGSNQGLSNRPLAPTIPSGFAGSTFTVAQNDAAEVFLSILPQDGYYEFGFDISYSLNGRVGMATIGSADEPYKAGGGDTETTISVDYDGKVLS